jgi:hypothetical protein
MFSRLAFAGLLSFSLTAHAALQVIVAQDGSGDFNGTDEKPILAAVQKVRAAGGGEILIRRGDYVCGQPIEVKDANKITFRGEPGAVLKLPPLQFAETSAEAAVGASELHVRVQQSLTPGLRLRIMASSAIDSFSGKAKPSFFVSLAKTEGDRLVLAKPLEFPVPAGTKIINEDAPNLFEVRSPCEDIAIEQLVIDGGRTPKDPVVSGHAQLCGIFASGRYTYTDGPTGPPVHKLIVRDCTIRNCFGRGIALYAVTGALIERCTIEDTVDEAVDLDHFAVGCIVSQNAVARCHVGVELNDANECAVVRNRFVACDTGINLWRWCKMPDLNTRNVIMENAFVGTKGNALNLAAGTATNIVSHNQIRGSGGKAILLAGDDYEVSGNDVDGKIADSGARNDVFDNAAR